MAAVTSTIAAGLTIAGGVAAGIGAVKRGSEARNKDTLSAAKAAEEIRNEQIALQNRETTNAKKGQLSQLERVTDDIRTNVGAANANASDSLFANFVESTKHYVEILDDDRTTDCSFQLFDGSADGNKPTSTTVTGLTHLEGETVEVIRDDIFLGTKTVASGEITIDQIPTT